MTIRVDRGVVLSFWNFWPVYGWAPPEGGCVCPHPVLIRAPAHGYLYQANPIIIDFLIMFHHQCPFIRTVKGPVRFQSRVRSCNDNQSASMHGNHTAAYRHMSANDAYCNRRFWVSQWFRPEAMSWKNNGFGSLASTSLAHTYFIQLALSLVRMISIAASITDVHLFQPIIFASFGPPGLKDVTAAAFYSRCNTSRYR